MKNCFWTEPFLVSVNALGPWAARTSGQLLPVQSLQAICGTPDIYHLTEEWHYLFQTEETSQTFLCLVWKLLHTPSVKPSVPHSLYPVWLYHTSFEIRSTIRDHVILFFSSLLLFLIIPHQKTLETEDNSITRKGTHDHNKDSDGPKQNSTSSWSDSRKEMVVRTDTQYLLSQRALYLSDHWPNNEAV